MLSVGIVGTGFVASKRADAIAADNRAHLRGVAGHTWDETIAFAHRYDTEPADHWSGLIADPAIDLVMVCHINRDHAAVAQSALEAGKSVVVEYPLALEVTAAEHLAELAHARRLLLHVAHVELLSGNHLALKASLLELGTIHYARYCTQSAKQRGQNHWTYSPALFGFPLVGAQSRFHRLINCFGAVDTVYCQNRYVNLHSQNGKEAYHQGCLSLAQLSFACGVMAEVVYGKGKAIWQSVRHIEVSGDKGGLILNGDQGSLITSKGTHSLPLGSRRGLFHQDTRRVIDCLSHGIPMYCSVEESVESLRVAVAAERSAKTGRSVTVG